MKDATLAKAPTGLRLLKLLAAAALLGALQWLGDAIVTRSGWPVSGSVLGMLMLLALLCLRGGVPASLNAVTAPLLRHLMLLLIPSVAAVSLYLGLLSQHAGVFVLTAVLATLLTVGVTAWVLQRLLRRQAP
ncbi:CidA/LrgA family protein [Azohydromonas caseinilytica]|uniref:CidA/LrgA family protein n=1 Tax=Azohydromonas caseinilytica TaxID=2728836 RepID=A0A848FKY8_9BURK|nr:CidA/LrgA family protein [Azohydromonas caseinilytica]NML18930.1 CidA/LrgA family protein [Azohydromonas caseinilytica]